MSHFQLSYEFQKLRTVTARLPYDQHARQLADNIYAMLGELQHYEACEKKAIKNGHWHRQALKVSRQIEEALAFFERQIAVALLSA